MKKTWLFSFYFLYFVGVASFRPYLVLHYQALGFTGTQIGLIFGVTPLVTIISLPLMTGLADKSNRHRLIMSLALLISVVILTVIPYLELFVVVFAVMLVYTVFRAPVMPLAASATMHMLGDQKELFSRMRLGGTIGYSIAATGVGLLVENHGLRIAFWTAAVAFFLAFVISQKMVHSDDYEKSKHRGRASELLKNPQFLLFLLLGFSGGIAAATLNTYLFPYMKELGAGESTMGLALTIGTIVEVPVLFFVSSFIKRFKAYTIVVFALGMTGLRFILLAIAGDPTFVLVIQLLNGVNHPLLSVAGATYTDEQAPPRFRATAQGLFNVATAGIGSAVGGFVGGLLFDYIGAKGMYLTVGLSIIVVIAFVTVARRFLPVERNLEVAG